jgi:hypothetical protein
MRSEMYEDKEDISTTLKDFHCTTCALSKFTKQILKSTEQRVKQSLDRLHFDLSEKQLVKSKSEAQYYVILIDEKTRYV